jgi:hypothetical protein
MITHYTWVVKYTFVKIYRTKGFLTMAFGNTNGPDTPSFGGGVPVPVAWVATAGTARVAALARLSGMLNGTKGDGDGTELGVDALDLDPGHCATHFVIIATPASITTLMVGSTDDAIIMSEQWNPLPTKMGCEGVDWRVWKSLETVASRQGSSVNMSVHV